MLAEHGLEPFPQPPLIRLGIPQRCFLREVEQYAAPPFPPVAVQRVKEQVEITEATDHRVRHQFVCPVKCRAAHLTCQRVKYSERGEVAERVSAFKGR